VFDMVGKKQEFDAKISRAIAEMPTLVGPTKGNAKGMEAIELARERLWHNQSAQVENVASAVVPVKHALDVRPAP